MDLFCLVVGGVASAPGPLPFAATTSTGEPRTDLLGQYEAGYLTLADIADMSLWPANLNEVPFDPETEAPADLIMTLDHGARTVAAVRGKRPLTPEEIEARKPPPPVPAILGKVEFITLVQMAGGMTDEMLVDAHANPLFAAFWIKLQMASVVQRDYPTTPAALDALAFAGYLPNGKAAVLAAWPTT
nr:hypothetical protein NG677_17500 [Methylobacterium sp. OTU13CASTA1]